MNLILIKVIYTNDYVDVLIDVFVITERQEEAIKRESLTAEVEHKVKQQLSQVLNDAQVSCICVCVYIPVLRSTCL